METPLKLGITRSLQDEYSVCIIIDGQYGFVSLKAAFGLDSNYSRYANIAFVPPENKSYHTGYQ
jgi:hypothetical protein